MATATVLQFVEDAKQDITSPSTSVFPSKMVAYKNMVSNLDEVLEVDRSTIQKFKRSVKAMHQSAQACTANELTYAENMERLGSVALSREAETGIGTAFLKFSVITKELCQMTKTLQGSFSNMVLFPLNSLLKGDVKSLGDLKRPFEESWKELRTKGTKVEKEARKKTQEIILYRTEQGSEETEKERKMFMYQSCEYLIKANEVKVKKGVELVQHLIEYYHAQLQYFHRGMELLENMRSYFDGLAGELQQLRSQQDEERRFLMDLRTQLKNAMQTEKAEDKKLGYTIHGQQGDRDYGTEKRGNLLKRSEGVRKQWQKRYIVVQNGQFSMAHNSTSTRTVTLNLLTCQVKPAAEKDARKNAFALVTQNRTYIFQAEDESDYEAWKSVISNAREEALKRAFGDGDDSLSKDSSSIATTLRELTEKIVSQVKKLPENDICVDCGAADPTWFSTNLGILVCIECSGIHREMGVHISRIRSLTLDKLGTSELLLAKAVGNGGFNEIMEAELDFSLKPTTTSKMEQRKEFMHLKYMQKKFVHKSESPPDVLLQDLSLAVANRDILAVLQLYAEGVDLTKPLPDYKCNGTALHQAIEQEDLTSLHVVDFLIQNSNKIDVQNTEGNTALHIAAMYDKPECLKLLLRGGADSNMKNKEGKTCLAIADEKGFSEIIEILKDVKDGKMQKLDNVKIDWGIDQVDGIYENPLDLIEDLKKARLELKDDEPAETPEQVSAPNIALPVTSQKPPKLKRSNPVRRSESLNSPPPRSMQTSKASANMPSGVALPGLTGKASSVKLPSSPPSEKSNAPQDQTDKLPLRPPPLPRKNPSTKSNQSSLPPASAGGTSRESVPVPGGVGGGVLSSFTPRSGTSQQKDNQVPEKSPPPPTPPARTSSSLPRPDRPAEPPRVIRHQRNASDGGIIDSLNSFVGKQQQHQQHPMLLPQQGKLKHADTYEEVVDVKVPPISKQASIDVPPPLPPPRPKDKPTSSQCTGGSQNKKPPESVQHKEEKLDTLPPTPPRAPVVTDNKQSNRPKQRRAKALYDCAADHDDELEFFEGDIIIIIGEADPEWLYGEVEGKPGKKGLFPINFVHMLSS